VIYVDLRGIRHSRRQSLFALHAVSRGNISVKVNYDTQRENTTAISVGYNIFNKTKGQRRRVAQPLRRRRPQSVGSCRVPNDKAEQAIKEIVAAVTE
jgi:hypothetical protein